VAGLVPGQRWGLTLRLLRGLALRLLLGLPLAARGCGRGEQVPPFLRRYPVPYELEEDASRGPAPRPIFGQHTAAILTLERVGEDGGTAVLAQRAQDLQEQGALRFLEGLRQRVNR
jgi:hypothetical protein